MKLSVWAALSAVAALGFAGAANAAAGLNGAYYAFDTAPETIANTQAMIAAAQGPTATFLTNNVCFPSCGGQIDDSADVEEFLGAGDFSNFSGNNVSPISDHGLELTGFVDVAQNGTYTFSLGSDDGSALFIDGVEVINDDGDHGFDTISNSNVILGAGLHSIEVLQFEDGGVTGLTFAQNAGALMTGVPEPATWAMMLSGFGLLGLGLRRRGGPAGLAATA